MLIQPRPLVPFGFGRRVFQSPLINGLVSYWSLDESSAGATAVTRSDSHGANHLSDLNNAASAAGILGNAVAVSSQRLTTASNSSLQTGDIDFTVSLWVYFAATSAALNVIACKSSSMSSNAGTEWGLFISTANRFTWRLSDGTNFTNIVPGDTAVTGAWYHLVGWHDSVNNVMGLAINGIETTQSYSGGVITNTAAVQIGGDGSASRYMVGRLDEIGFWKRVLTSAERSSLYHSGIGLAYPFL